MAPQEGRIIAALVSAGLSGTIAVLGAGAARIDLFSQFRWGATDDFALALTLASAVIILEAALFAPRYDMLLAGVGRPAPGGGRRRPGAVGLQLRTAGVGELLSADSVAATLVLQQACWTAAQVVRGRGGAPVQGPDGQPAPEPVSAVATDVGLVLVREWAKELLQRGLVFTFAAAWLTDRAFEAGADDTLTLLPPSLVAALTGGSGSGGDVLYLTDAVRYAVAALLTLSLVPPVLNEADALRVGVASNLALVEVSKLDVVDERVEARQAERAAAAAAAAATEAAKITAAAAAAAVTVSASALTAAGQEAESESEAGPRSAAAGSSAASDAGAGPAAVTATGSALGQELTAAAAAATSAAEGLAEDGEGQAFDEGVDDAETESMLREYRLIDALGRSTSTGPPRLTYALTIMRGVLRFGAANAAFALTGNLAATLLASALPNLLLLAYVRAGPKVLLEGTAPPAGGGKGGKGGAYKSKAAEGAAGVRQRDGSK